MNKVVIAHSVLAGLTISQRLSALEVDYDEQLFDAIGDLAGGLAKVLSAVEILDQAVAVSIRLIEDGRTQDALEGLNMIKEGTAELVSEQDTIRAAMGISEEPNADLDALLAMLAALSAK